MKAPAKKIAYVINCESFFVSHRLPLALRAIQDGWNVRLFTGYSDFPGSVSMDTKAILSLRKHAISHVKARFMAGGFNPCTELFGFIQLTWLLYQFKPDIIHCVTPKGIIYGGFAAKLVGIKNVVLAISGLGYFFTQSRENSKFRILIRKIYLLFLPLAFKHRNQKIIVQNTDDMNMIISGGYASPAEVVLIQGSGVCLSDFNNCSSLDKEDIVLLPARMLRDKGVVEFVQAAKSIHKVMPHWRFLLAGSADCNNPSTLTAEEIKCWQREGFIEWLGYVDNICDLFKRSAIVCLPSYREGMPKALLEAAAAACAIVTTDVPGCREAIVAGETGDLVPVMDPDTLSQTLLNLMIDRDRRVNYGSKGQKRAQELFSIDDAINKTLNIYQDILSKKS